MNFCMLNIIDGLFITSLCFGAIKICLSNVKYKRCD